MVVAQVKVSVVDGGCGSGNVDGEYEGRECGD